MPFKSSSLIPLVFACFALLLLVGCDSEDPSGSDPVTLFHEIDDAFRFTFNADDIQAGRLEDLRCDCNVNISSFLFDQGFSTSEIISASVESVQLEMLFPISAQASILNQAIVKLEAEGVSATEIANQSSFPNSRSATLSVLTNRDIAALLERPSFTSILQIDANELEANRNYEMALVLRLRIEVEGGLVQATE